MISSTVVLLKFVSVHVCRRRDDDSLMAVKLINLRSLFTGAITDAERKSLIKQIEAEIAFHRECSNHENVITFIGANKTAEYKWIAMEYAEGGDLFDKIGKPHILLYQTC